MIFCNTLDCCRAAEHYLREKDIHTLCYHGDIPLDGRREAIQNFTGDAGMDGQAVLVCTDLAARSVLFLRLQRLVQCAAISLNGMCMGSPHEQSICFCSHDSAPKYWHRLART